MSQSLDVMQFILDVIDEAVFATAAKQIGFTSHDKIDSGSLQFVQIYEPVFENSEEEEQRSGELTFTLDFFAEEGNATNIRNGMERLGKLIHADNSLGGLVDDAIATANAVAERPTDNRAFGTMVITVRFKEVVFEDPLATQILDFSDVTFFSLPFGLALIEDSKEIKGTLGIRRDAASGGGIILDASTAIGHPGFPKNLADVRRLRLLYHMSEEYGEGMDADPRLSLFSDVAKTVGNTYAPPDTAFINSVGWMEVAYDLENPTSTVGGGLGTISLVEVIEITFNMFFAAAFSSLEFGLIFASCYFEPRDQQGNNGRGYRPGF